jgi:hypothetical protein
MKTKNNMNYRKRRTPCGMWIATTFVMSCSDATDWNLSNSSGRNRRLWQIRMGGCLAISCLLQQSHIRGAWWGLPVDIGLGGNVQLEYTEE